MQMLLISFAKTYPRKISKKVIRENYLLSKDFILSFNYLFQRGF